MPVIGYLYAGSPDPSANLLRAFRKGLNEVGERRDTVRHTTNLSDYRIWRPIWFAVVLRQL